MTKTTDTDAGVLSLTEEFPSAVEAIDHARKCGMVIFGRGSRKYVAVSRQWDEAFYLGGSASSPRKWERMRQLEVA